MLQIGARGSRLAKVTATILDSVRRPGRRMVQQQCLFPQWHGTGDLISGSCLGSDEGRQIPHSGGGLRSSGSTSLWYSDSPTRSIAATSGAPPVRQPR